MAQLYDDDDDDYFRSLDEVIFARQALQQQLHSATAHAAQARGAASAQLQQYADEATIGSDSYASDEIGSDDEGEDEELEELDDVEDESDADEGDSSGEEDGVEVDGRTVRTTAGGAVAGAGASMGRATRTARPDVVLPRVEAAPAAAAGHGAGGHGGYGGGSAAAAAAAAAAPAPPSSAISGGGGGGSARGLRGGRATKGPARKGRPAAGGTGQAEAGGGPGSVVGAAGDVDADADADADMEDVQALAALGEDDSEQQDEDVDGLGEGAAGAGGTARGAHRRRRTRQGAGSSPGGAAGDEDWDPALGEPDEEQRGDQQQQEEQEEEEEAAEDLGLDLDLDGWVQLAVDARRVLVEGGPPGGAAQHAAQAAGQADQGAGQQGAGQQGDEDAAARVAEAVQLLARCGLGADPDGLGVGAAEAGAGDEGLEGAGALGGRLARLLAALDTNRALQGQLSSMLCKLDEHSNTSYTLEQHVEAQPVVRRPSSSRARDKALQRATAGARTGAPAHPTSRYWRIGSQLPAPTREFTTLAAAQQLPPRSYERVRWPQRMVDALNRGLTLEVQSVLTQRVMDALQQEQRQQAGRAAAGGPAAAAAAAGAGGGLAGASLQERMERIKAVRPDSPEATPIILALDAAAWERVAAAHRVGRSGAECSMYYRHNLRPGLQWPLQESTRLMELAEKYGNRHWEKVAEELGTGRHPGHCLAHALRWKRFDRRPERSTWGAEDDARLEELVGKYGTDWVAISDAFEGRYDRHQVRDRWHGTRAAGGERRVGKWDAQEDALLTQAVTELGCKWAEVARRVPGRTPRQCRERWVNMLQPGLKRSEFTAEEEQVLAEKCRELQAAYGRIIWSKAAECLPGRTDDQCSRAYDNMVKYKKARRGRRGPCSA